jgi:hypothetical protein
VVATFIVEGDELVCCLDSILKYWGWENYCYPSLLAKGSSYFLGVISSSLEIQTSSIWADLGCEGTNSHWLVVMGPIEVVPCLLVA